MQKLKLQNSWNKDTKSFDKEKFELKETEGTISGKVSISSKKNDEWINKVIPFVIFKSRADDLTIRSVMQSGGKTFEADCNIAVDSFIDQSGKEIKYFKLIINQAKLEGIDAHSQAKGNAFQAEIEDDEIPF